MNKNYTFKSKLWIYAAEKASWHFMTLPKDIADEIKFFSNMGKRRGWGSVKVDVSIGNTSWNTSIFPNDGDYILPVKANVRKAESLINGKMVSVKLTANFPV